MLNQRSRIGVTRNQARLFAQYGPWAVVTGASSGLGREMAIQLAEAGINLVLVARREEVLAQMAVDLAARTGIEARVLAADLAVAAEVASIVEATQDLEIGLLIAAAGFGTSGPFLESELEHELAMLDVNCRALLLLTHRFAQRFAKQGRGGIVLMSSLVGFQGVPLAAHYSATKAYVQALAEALHVEFAPFHVDVLASAPGPTHTGFAARAGQRMRAALQPGEVAESTLAALGKRGTVLPGLLTQVLSYSLALLPRWARVQIMGRVMEGMTNHRRSAQVIEPSGV